MVTRGAWIDSRHLRESVEGGQALAALESLDPAARERVLRRGDRIAAESASLAHAYLPAACRAAALASDGFERWEHLLLSTLGEKSVARDLALAFLRIPPSAVAAWSADVGDAWTETTRRLGEISKRLAATWAGATADACLGEARLEASTVRAWRSAAEALVARGGWRSEFLAESFLQGASALLGRIDDDAVAAWAELVASIGTTGRSPRPPAVPPGLARLAATTRSAILSLAARAAETDVKAAARLLETLPAAAASCGDAADDWVAAVARCRSYESLADAVALMPGVARGIRREDAPFLLDMARAIAGAAPEHLPAFLRAMDRALEDGGREGVELWVRRGLEIAASHGDAAGAHFRLETRTAHKLLVERSSAVAFDEVEGMLRRYLTMMSRRSFALVSAPGVWLRPPLAAPEDVGLRLPERIDLFPSSEDNLALYKAIATHVAGRFEYGTYAFDLGELARRGWAPPPVAEERDEAADIVAFLASFPNPLLASALFALLEGIRVEARLEADFPGLRRDLGRLGRMYADSTVPAAADRHDERLLETLFHMGVGRRGPGELDARLREQGRALASSVDLLRTPDATVYDSAALTIAYYDGLAFADARASDDDDEVAFVEMGGATVVDPFEHLDAGERRENTAPWRPDPARALGDEESGKARLALSDEEQPTTGSGRPLSLEELRSLLERGDVRVSESRGEIEGGLGLYVTDLLGKLPAEQIRELRERIAEGDRSGVIAWLSRQAAGTSFYYDEWDHRIGDYRRRWCRVAEIDGDEDAGEWFSTVLERSADLVQQIKRDFQLLRPDQLRRVPRTEQGEEFDLNALVEAHADRRSRRTPSERVYVERRPEERDVSTLFLIDMSASTDEPLPGLAREAGARRVIDLTKDTLAILAQVLDEIGDSFAIYGFSGHGRANVEVYRVKSFAERLSDGVRARLGGIAPKRSTRMGAALRHAGEKLARTTAKARHLILLSDGFPQDFDYGDDRRSNVYGLRDTMQALRELEKRGMQTFCITVDPAGRDYLGEMCPSSRYAVIDDVHELPSELVRLYRKITRS